MLKNTIGCYLLSFLDCWNKTTSVIKFELSTSTLNSVEVLGKARTEAVMIAIFNMVKVCYWSGPHMSESKIVNFVFLIFLILIFLFIYFLTLNLGLGVSIILHMNVTNYYICHYHYYMIMYHTEEYKRF